MNNWRMSLAGAFNCKNRYLFLALPFSEKYGGLESGWDTVALVQEEMGRKGWMVGSLFNRAVGFGGMSLVAYGSETQKSELMPKLINEGLLFALGLTEPQAGSDASAIITRARKKQDRWVINGLKTSLITSITGGIIMLFSTVLWYFFIRKHSLLVA